MLPPMFRTNLGRRHCEDSEWLLTKFFVLMEEKYSGVWWPSQAACPCENCPRLLGRVDEFPPEIKEF